ncbi:hypothetical protein M6D93_05805 [Jatrophihabitans telluris]|uniref:Uncharacterized protein n=1 Tax=Jatrophihabitans telluris TaxID=2038343 RepID=A0ABY4R2Z6_9ACTN|nr:hypothetical protein [Jatrophihabitans telluris]UQX89520.1 hypothetical protein M6D93_05805 [Jatrophihabitans telluris]
MSEKKIQPVDPKSTDTGEAGKAVEAEQGVADRKTGSDRIVRASGRKTGSSRWH